MALGLGLKNQNLLLNLITLLSQCERSIQERMVGHFRKCDEDYGQCVAEGLQLTVGESVAQNAVVS
jgi:catalase